MNVNASDLSVYCFCPRAVYLSKVINIKPEPTVQQSMGLVSHAIRKELSLRQPKILNKVSDVSEIRSLLESEVDKVLRDAPYIYKSILSGVDASSYFSTVRSEIFSELSFMEKKLRSLVEEMGLDDALHKITPKWVEYPVKSDELMLCGRIDKVMSDPPYVPVEIKTGAVPYTLWEGDRIQTCAYVMLLEDWLSLNKPIDLGFVEYTRITEMRSVIATEGLRRRVIEVRDSVLDILDGFVPEICPHGSGKKCESCGFKEQCYDI